MPLFRTALIDAVTNLIKNHLNKEVNLPQNELDQPLSLFFIKLHKVAEGPKNVDPLNWAVDKLPYLLDLFEAAMDELNLDESESEGSVSENFVIDDPDSDFRHSDEASQNDCSLTEDPQNPEEQAKDISSKSEVS